MAVCETVKEEGLNYEYIKNLSDEEKQNLPQDYRDFFVQESMNRIYANLDRVLLCMDEVIDHLKKNP